MKKSLKTHFYSDERCFWHGGGNYAQMLPVGGFVQQLVAGGLPEGPGCRPFTRDMPIRTAAMVEPGMPSVSNGIMEGPDTALLAASGAAMPSTIPVPHFSLFLERRFSSP